MTETTTAKPIVVGINAALGFALEVAMVSAFLFWGFKQDSPWHLILGIGLPAVVVVFWGAFMAPRSDRRLPLTLVRYLALGLFLAAALALISVGSTVLGSIMAVLAVANFVAALALKQ